ITHMLRNAIDHGLESAEEREAAGKPAEGTVRLAALHRSGRIVIEIADDGKGINRPRGSGHHSGRSGTGRPPDQCRRRAGHPAGYAGPARRRKRHGRPVVGGDDGP
ncbi:ATP-binding protein, partial [Brevundimonas sp.]|uniref:ATP-binding protein n=1 Tax=Brevundimonas sp. TaxID=1871086 RepID=UPI0039C8807D